MSKKVEFYSSAYGNLAADVYRYIRHDTYGHDIGQSSWLTAYEYDKFADWLGIGPATRVLETASGSGGPALYLVEKFGCAVIGIDINAEGVKGANQMAAARGISNAEFRQANVDERFPFDDATFDAAICIDAANHFSNRAHVLREWRRVLKPGGRALFTDPVVITGPVSSEEIAARSNIGFFVFVPAEVTEKFIRDAGFKLLKREDVTDNIAMTSGRWHDARESYRDAVITIEGEERFAGLQLFLSTVHKLTSERRLSRYAFLMQAD